MKEKKTTYNDRIKQLFKAKLSPQEREELNTCPLINQALENQWEESSCLSTDSVKEEKILQGIRQSIEGHKIPKRSFYRLHSGWAAAIVMAILCGAWSLFLLHSTQEKEIWYVRTAGHQCMDSIFLADGSKVILNAGGKLTYPSDFSKEKREVHLSGQAFFYIHHDPKHPFTVHTKSMNVTALGTAFEVFSFDADDKAETILLNGKTLIETKDKQNQIKQRYILQPNDKLTLNANGRIEIEQTNADNYSAWRSGGRLKFKGEPLSMILPRLEKWYGQKISCSRKVAEFYRFTFSIRNESLEQMLNIMTQTAPLSYKLINDDYYEIKEITDK